MNKFLLVLIAAMVSNCAVAMRKADGTIMRPDRMQVTRNPFNKEAAFLAAGGTAGLLSALLERNVVNIALGALTMLVACELDKGPRLRIQMFSGDTLVEDTYTQGNFNCEQLIAEKQAEIDRFKNERDVQNVPRNDDQSELNSAQHDDTDDSEISLFD